MSPLVDLREFPPVEEKVERPEKASQSLLARMDVCPRSAFLYRKYGGGTQSHAMARGEVFHETVERLTQLLMDSDEKEIPPEVAKDHAQAVIEERTDLVLPEYEQDAVRLMAWNWAQGTIIDAEHVIACETMVELELGDWTIRGKIDRAEAYGPEALVIDYKTSLAMPSQEQFERGFQGKFYALLIAEGKVEGQPFPIGRGLQGFVVSEVYPRFIREESGELANRTTDRPYTRDELSDFKRTLLGHLEKLDHGFKTGEWPAVDGSHCATCSAPSECPIPEHLREIHEIATLADAEAAGRTLAWKKKEIADLQTSLREFAKENGAIFFDADQVWDFGYSESRSVKDFDKLRAAIMRTVELGEDFNLEDHVTVRKSNKFGIRKLTEEEREAA